jgi:NADP-reducing hydrogenase subunit HndB
MAKLKSMADLNKLKDQLKLKVEQGEASPGPGGKVYIKVAMATCGIASGAKTVMEFLVDELEKRSIDAIVTQTGCMGYCYAEPTIEVKLPNQEPVVFGFVDTQKADEIIEKYIKNNELVGGIIPLNYNTIDN